MAADCSSIGSSYRQSHGSYIESTFTAPLAQGNSQSEILTNIQRILAEHPLTDSKPVFPSRGFEKEKKLIKAVISYEKSVVKLQKSLDEFSKSSNTESATQLLERSKKVQQHRNKLNFYPMLTSDANRAMAHHDAVLKQAAALASNALQCETLIEENTNPISKNECEILIQNAREIEEKINFTEIDLKYDAKGGFNQYFCDTCLTQLGQAHTLYQRAYKGGLNSALEDMHRVAKNMQLFHDLKSGLRDHWIFRMRGYVRQHMWINTPYPMQYNDARLEPLLRILLSVSEDDSDLGNAACFIKLSMSLDSKLPVTQTLINYAHSLVCSKSFSKGSADMDEKELQEYRSEVLERLIKLASFAKEPLTLPICHQLPGKLEVNLKNWNGPCMTLVRFAHRTGLKMSGQLDWQIAQWMSLLNAQRLRNYVLCYTDASDCSEKTQVIYNYLSRLVEKTLGLLINPEELSTYEPKEIPPFCTNLRAAALASAINQAHVQWCSYIEKLSEKILIDHLMTCANANDEFGAAFIAQLQGFEGHEGYFQEDQPKKLSAPGARALLFASGYLIKATPKTSPRLWQK